MTPDTLIALRLSIKKWDRISRGVDIDMGSDNCALCHAFARLSCQGCPVEDATKAGCDVGPYDDWLVARRRLYHEGHIGRIGPLVPDDPAHAPAIAAAVAMRDFLVALIPPGETP